MTMILRRKNTMTNMILKRTVKKKEDPISRSISLYLCSLVIEATFSISLLMTVHAASIR